MSKVFCLKFPNKKRYGKYNLKRAQQDARNFQREFSKNFRVYNCEDCGGYHLSTKSRSEYFALSEKSLDNNEVIA